MARRVRLVAATIHFDLVIDDGEHLEILPTDPLSVTAAQWPPDLDGLIGQLQDRLDAETAPLAGIPAPPNGSTPG